jgi:hypothetical protein
MVVTKAKGLSMNTTSKLRTALFQEGENDEPMATQSVFDAQDTHENISKLRMALFKEGEDDESIVSQNISKENSCPVPNMVTSLQFGAFSSDEKYIKKAKEIFAPGGLLAMVIFKGATFKNEDLCWFYES